MTAVSDDTTSGCDAPYTYLQTLVATPDSLALLVGERAVVHVVGQDRFGAQLQVSPLRWESDDPSIATVDANGVVRGEAVGATNVTAASLTGKRVLVPVRVMAPLRAQ